MAWPPHFGQGPCGRTTPNGQKGMVETISKALGVVETTLMASGDCFATKPLPLGVVSITLFCGGERRLLLAVSG